ncbi:hypothetical protein, partial [Plasmodium yoelii yoelii]
MPETRDTTTLPSPLAVWFELSGFHGSVDEPTIVVCLSPDRRDIADGFQQAVVVEPGYPFQGGEFDGLPALPGCSAVDRLGLVQAVDGFGQGVVIAVATASDGGLDPGLGQALGIADGDVLRASVAVVNQGIGAFRLPGVQGLLQCVQDEVGPHRMTDPPAHNAPGKHVNHEGHIQPALPGRDVGEVRHPQLIGTIHLELPVDPIQRARDGVVGHRGAHHLATPHTGQPQPLHQALDRATGDLDTFAVQRAPDLVGAIHLHVGVPDPLNFWHQNRIALGTRGKQAGVALLRRMAPIPGRGNPQDLADRLDPVAIPVPVDEVSQDSSRRSSSAWAKNALASF